MIEQTYQVLGFHRLLEILSTYATCPPGRAFCLALKPSHDLDRIESELNLVSEMRLLLKAEGFASFSGVEDLSPLLERAQVEGAYLEGGECLTVARTVEAAEDVRKRLRRRKLLFPGLSEIAGKLPALDGLAREILRCVSPQGAVKDEASSELRRIRRKKKGLREQVERRLEGFRFSHGLSERDRQSVVSVREGRYVVSLRSDLKSRFGGIVHGYSNSRATCFFEPVEVIADNNRMAELEQDERAEVIRILAGLTREVASRIPDLRFSQFLVARLDSLRARARFAEEFGCVSPLLGTGGGIRLLEARNPLLVAMAMVRRESECTRVVPVDVRVEGGKRLLIVSGPNRGGKTVTLKTIGLLGLMTQAGLHIPAREGSRLPVFDGILAEIGDDQDLEAGASTFSAHAGHLKYILENAGPHTLVLIDEPGMGTDPDEGAALAMAVLDELMEREAFVAVSTHYNRLKAYGILHERAVNASVFFDEAENRPTFELRYGSPGVSRGLEVARNVGLPEGVLGRAAQYLDRDEVRLNHLIEKLNGRLREASRREDEAEEARRRFEAAEAAARQHAIQEEEERARLLESLQAGGEALLADAREELRKTINALKRKESSQSETTRTLSRVQEKLKARLGGSAAEYGDDRALSLRPGTRVRLKKLGGEGIVHSLDPERGRAEIMVGNVKVTASLTDLEAAQTGASPQRPGGGGGISWTMRERVPMEVNVIGYRVSDALPLIDRTLDQALVEGERSLRIIHGYGTGRLRGAIRAHLEGVPHVRRVSSADPRYGGDAITVVELT